MSYYRGWYAHWNWALDMDGVGLWYWHVYGLWYVHRCTDGHGNSPCYSYWVRFGYFYGVWPGYMDCVRLWYWYRNLLGYSDWVRLRYLNVDVFPDGVRNGLGYSDGVGLWYFYGVRFRHMDCVWLWYRYRDGFGYGNWVRLGYGNSNVLRNGADFRLDRYQVGLFAYVNLRSTVAVATSIGGGVVRTDSRI